MDRKEECMLHPWGNLVYAFAWGVIVSALLLIGTFTYWTTYPYRGLHDVVEPIPISEPVVAHGQLLTYTISYCVDESLPLPMKLYREFRLQGPDGIIFPLPAFVDYEISQRCETRRFAIDIPYYYPEGVYRLHVTTELQVNPLRFVKQAFVSDQFRIIKPPVPSKQFVP